MQIEHLIFSLHNALSLSEAIRDGGRLLAEYLIDWHLWLSGTRLMMPAPLGRVVPGLSAPTPGVDWELQHGDSFRLSILSAAD